MKMPRFPAEIIRKMSAESQDIFFFMRPHLIQAMEFKFFCFNTRKLLEYFDVSLCPNIDTITVRFNGDNMCT